MRTQLSTLNSDYADTTDNSDYANTTDNSDYADTTDTVFKTKAKGSKVLILELKSNESREYYDRDARALQSVQRLWLDNAEEPS